MSGLAIRQGRKQRLYEEVFEDNRCEVDFEERGKSLFAKSTFHYFVKAPPLSIIETIASLWKSLVSCFRSFFVSRYSYIAVKREDTFNAAEKEVKLGKRVLVLNFASTEEPGGGFNEGHKGGQEEDLCRRSDLGAMMLYTKEVEQLVDPEVWNLNRQVVYTPSVKVFRADERKEYKQLEKDSFNVGILSCGALCRPSVSGTLYTHKKDKEQMKERIYTQLFIAQKNGYDTLILGAFGCGAFKNPPEEVAKLYRSIIQNYFSKSFRRITFAILDDPTRSHSNLDIFKRELG